MMMLTQRCIQANYGLSYADNGQLTYRSDPSVLLRQLLDMAETIRETPLLGNFPVQHTIN